MDFLWNLLINSLSYGLNLALVFFATKPLDMVPPPRAS